MKVLLLVAILFSLLSTSYSLPNVAFLTAEDLPNYLTDVVKQLSPYFNITTILVTPGQPIPPLSLLQQFPVIFAWTNHAWVNPAQIGSLLVQSVNSGVPLVLAMFSFQNLGNEVLQGGFYPSYYGIQPGTALYGPRATLGSFDPTHPIMSGVTSFDGGPQSYRTVSTVNPNVTVVATWSDNNPLIATFTINGVRRVDLGFYPVSNRVDSNNWLITTNGTLIMVNAINYAMSSSSCAAQTSCSSCTNAGCQWCLDTGVCSSFDPTCKNRVNTPKNIVHWIVLLLLLAFHVWILQMVELVVGVWIIILVFQGLLILVAMMSTTQNIVMWK